MLPAPLRTAQTHAPPPPAPPPPPPSPQLASPTDAFVPGDTSAAEGKHTNVKTAESHVADDVALATLASLGFDMQLTRLALETCKGDVDGAANWLLCHTGVGCSKREQPNASTEEAVQDIFPLFSDDTSEQTAIAAATEELHPAPIQASSTAEPAEPAEPATPATSPATPASHTASAASTLEDTNSGDAAPIPFELQRLFAFLQCANQVALSTEALTDSFGWQRSQAAEQQDVHELNRLLFEAMEDALVGSSGENLITGLYKGQLTNSLVCLSCNCVHEHTESFQDLPVVVQGFASLEQSIRAFTTWEYLTGENQYFCDECGQKVDAKKGVCFAQLPPILALPLRRFEYDFREDKRKKIDSPFEFPLVLDMGRFKKPVEPGSAVPEDPSESSDLYTLFSVVIHSGGAYGGHYHCLVKDLLGEGDSSSSGYGDGKCEWLDFNDSRVSPLPGESCVARTFGGHADCAYMLFYRRRDLKVPRLESVQPPECLMKEVSLHNERLVQVRAEYDRAVNEVSVTVCGEQHFRVDSGVIYEPKSDTEFTATIVIDQRHSLGQLLSLIKAIPFLTPLLSSGRFQLNEVWETTGTVCRVQPTAIDLTDLEKTVKDANVPSGVRLLAWDGTSLHNESYDPRDASVLLLVSWKPLTGPNDKRDVPVAVKCAAPLRGLKAKLEEITGLPVEVQRLVNVTNRHKSALLDDDSKPVGQCHLYDMSKLHLLPVVEEVEKEKTTPTDAAVSSAGEISRATRKASSDDVQIFVTDHCSTALNALSQCVTIEKDKTVFELKQLIFASLPGPQLVSVDAAVLRRALSAGASGTRISESVTVEAAGLREGDRLIIEPGTPDDGLLEVMIRFSVERLAVMERPPFTASLQKSLTCWQCKKQAADYYGVDPETVRLRKSDVFDMPAGA
eukprot:TRINITY_DN6729_c0_g1_i2.p1 TRINITY_DN6729_c0_g1~~TRINITY_DN6729_c0_g1_i2.p1  ORF type:complete len:996 (+),score=234.19 TRINITY_DN6729_c0_g1_i2:275-2989(+)